MLSQTITSDTSDLKKFLKAFCFEKITVSIQGKGKPPLPQGAWFSARDKIRAIPMDQFFNPSVQNEIQRANALGYEIYFLINEGDGAPDPDADDRNLNCGKKTNIIKLRSLAIDMDSADLNLLVARFKELGLSPHLIVESSPGRYHFYFLIVPASVEDAELWRTAQRRLYCLVPGLDSSVDKINQQLRLPGFFNWKRDKPTEVKLYKAIPSVRESLPDWVEGKLKGLRESLPGASGNVTNGGTAVYVNGVISTYTPFVYSARKSLTEGQRRPAICHFIEHLLENIVPLDKWELLWTHVDPFIENYCKHGAEDYLPGGVNRENIEQYARDQIGWRRKKHEAQSTKEVLAQFDKAEALEQSVLPDSFYLEFPGDLGMIVRELHAYVPAVSLEMCFAAALCISGGLKAELFLLKGHWPVVNGIVIAHTAAGKTKIKKIIQTLFHEAGLVGRFSQLIPQQKTVQSLHNQLRAAGGVATTIVDEAGGYLEGLESKHSSGHVKDIKGYMKDATSGDGSGSWLTPGESVNNVTGDMILGYLSVWLLIQPSMFNRSLSMSDMRDGFLPRFLIFRGKSNIRAAFRSDLPDDRDDYTFKPSMDLKVWLNSLSSLRAYNSDLDLVDTLNEAVKKAKEENPHVKEGGLRIARTYAVYKARLEAREGSYVAVRFSEEADVAQAAYLKEWEDKTVAISEEDPESPLLDVLLRYREMFYRLCCNGAMFRVEQSVGRAQQSHRGTGSAVVSLELVEAIIQFHKFQTERFFKGELADMGKDRELEEVVTATIKAFVKKGEPVTANEIRRSLTSGERWEKSRFSTVLKEAVAQERVVMQEQERALHRSLKKTVYYPAPLEP